MGTPSCQRAFHDLVRDCHWVFAATLQDKASIRQMGAHYVWVKISPSAWQSFKGLISFSIPTPLNAFDSAEECSLDLPWALELTKLRMFVTFYCKTDSIASTSYWLRLNKISSKLRQIKQFLNSSSSNKLTTIFNTILQKRFLEIDHCMDKFCLS